MKIAFIDRAPESASWYSYQLAENLGASYKTKIEFYCPKKTPINKIGSQFNMKPVWGSYLFFIQIPIQAIKDNVDLVHIQFEFVMFKKFISSIMTVPMLMILKMVGKRVIITLHGPIYPKSPNSKGILDLINPQKKFMSSLLLLLVPIFYKSLEFFCDGIIVHAKIFKKWMAEWGLIKKIHFIPHGYEKIMVSDNKSLEKHNSILYFGFISPRKGLSYLVDIFKDILLYNPKMRLILAGEAPKYYKNYKIELLKKIKCANLENKITFKGYVAESELNNIFSNVDVVVFPYISSTEASGALSTAARYNVPVVLSNTPYFLEINDETSFPIVNPIAHFDAAKIVYNILENSEERILDIQSLHKLSQNNSWEKIAKMHLNLFEKILSNPNEQ